MRPVLVIIGPSGSGKSSVVRMLAGRGVLRVHPTWTTRPRRADERTGSLEHRFVCESTFDVLERQGFFLDTVALFGHRYGLPPVRRSDVGPLDTVMLRAPLVARFTAVVPDVHVVQIEDDPARLRARLEARGCPPAELEARLRDNELEIVAGRRIADRVLVNDGSLVELADAVAA